MARTLDIVGDKWSLLIVRDCFDGLKRFSDFQQGLGIAKNILSERLNTLVEKDILRRQHNATGTRAHYQLTERGRDLFTVILGLRQWGERNTFDVGEEHSSLIDKQTGRAVPRLIPVNGHGTPLDELNSQVQRVSRTAS